MYLTDNFEVACVDFRKECLKSCELLKVLLGLHLKETFPRSQDSKVNTIRT